MKRVIGICGIAIMGLMLSGCQTFNTEHGYGIVDYGNDNSDALKNKMRQLLIEKNTVVSIIQFGDAHTSTGYFIETLRHLMQQRFGNAGIGWMTPIAINRSAYQWDIINSQNTLQTDFPMGGYIAKPKHNGAEIKVVLNSGQPRVGLWNVHLMLKSKTTEPISILDTDGKADLSYSLMNIEPNQWRVMNTVTTMPFSIRADSQVELGGLWLQKHNQPGVIVSAVGMKDAQLVAWNQWSPQWLSELQMTNSDLVILEYGTNEALDKNLDAQEYRTNLVTSIQRIRKQLPNAVILLLSPPDLMIQNQQKGTCVEHVPISYEIVKSTQIAVAKAENLLYWDWQKAMGGRCNIAKWYSEGLAQKDLIHLTPLGYEISAEILYQSLLQYWGIAK
ncbi:GDSL-type esterase/lipase family protein [Wohlfahrtiimonas larvae]|uniref:SGNH/GDSL hydrolase family protein n=1 Tax=Wohlfahrtiimonas larvae TaxID=1157986 RepID=A0ABP9MX78_9GAMM|nr:GDSL-type esterase/lipase family protein [Wohlfahrtiimonas larvae]